MQNRVFCELLYVITHRIENLHTLVADDDEFSADMQSISSSENSSSVEFVFSLCAVGAEMSGVLVTRHSFSCAVGAEMTSSAVHFPLREVRQFGKHFCNVCRLSSMGAKLGDQF